MTLPFLNFDLFQLNFGTADNTSDLQKRVLTFSLSYALLFFVLE